MKNLFKLAYGGVVMLVASMATAADDVTIQLKWVTQTQFAGYYVALDNGYYSDEGLDVTIKPGGVDISPPQVMAAGGADVMLNWMPSALSARENGPGALLNPGKSIFVFFFTLYAGIVKN